ncbi:MAG: acyl-CoA reductase [Verrucomicrobiia bacterium]|jgi:hypothetical protein
MNTRIQQIRQAINHTREARERVLQHRRTDAIIGALAQTARSWLEPSNPWRQHAIKQAPSASGFSSAMAREAVDLTFEAITEEALGELLDHELCDRHVLDEFCPRGGMRTRATGPRLIVHFLAGNVPAPGIVSICSGLLLKSANLVKVSSRDPVFPPLFVESLRAVDAELADCVAVLDWRREDVALTQVALADADAVIAYGDDETISTLRRMCPPEARFLGYGHKLSFAVVAKEALTASHLPSLAQSAAFDASVYDQQGCLSPHVFYVEERGQLGPRQFAAALAKAMAAYQARVPRGELPVEEAAQIAKLRGAYEFRSASDKTVAVWLHTDGTTDLMNGGAGLRACPNPTAQVRPELATPVGAGTPVPPRLYEMGSSGWLVIYEDDPMFTPSCLNRVVFVKPIERLEHVPELVRRFASNLSTVGIAPLDERAMALAGELANIGVNRVCRIGQMQRPPLTWQHDGRPNLADLVRWTDLG